MAIESQKSLYGEGHEIATTQTSVKFRDFVVLYLR